jgi:hypothetical protein
MDTNGGLKPRLSAFHEMPYDDSILNAMRLEEKRLPGGPERDAYRILMQTIQMDLNRGGVLMGGDIVGPILKEMERIIASGQEEFLFGEEVRSRYLMTLSGYVPTDGEWEEHETHDPTMDRFDDCPLCWADVLSDDQRGWLQELGQGGKGNSIAETMGLQPLKPDESVIFYRRGKTKGDDNG